MPWKDIRKFDMELNNLPKQYLKGKCLESGDKLRDLGNPILSLGDYKAIMYKNMSKLDESAANTIVVEDETQGTTSPDLKSTGKITITKVYPWYLS